MTIREIEVLGKSLWIAEHDNLSDEAGAVIWDAALVLVHYLGPFLKAFFSSESVRRPRVIELGAGTGVVGLAAALAGAHVTVTDLPHLLDGILKNVERNQLGERVAVRELAWGEGVERFEPPYDLVLGSDLIYQLEALPSLFRTIRALSGCRGRALLSLELRPLVVEAARREAAHAGLSLRQVQDEELDPLWQSPDIQVWELTPLC
eukprot:jgi/Botrbrau1/5045/Bobra.37_1s0011.1